MKGKEIENYRVEVDDRGARLYGDSRSLKIRTGNHDVEIDLRIFGIFSDQ